MTSLKYSNTGISIPVNYHHKMVKNEVEEKLFLSIVLVEAS